LLIGQPLAGADRFHHQATPEMVLPIHLEGLSAEGQDEAHAFFPQPEKGWMGLRHQDLGQLRIGKSFRDPHHIAIEIILRVLPDISGSFFFRRHIGDECLDIVHTIVGATDDPTGEIGIAAAEILRGFL
jgi:hypothetical protein